MLVDVVGGVGVVDVDVFEVVVWVWLVNKNCDKVVDVVVFEYIVALSVLEGTIQLEDKVIIKTVWI